MILPEIWRRMVAQEKWAVGNGRGLFASSELKHAVGAALRRLFFRGLFHALQHFLKIVPRKEPAVQNHARNFLDVADVLKGIGVEENEVGDFSVLDGAELIFHVKKARGIELCRLQGFKRGEASSHEALQFLVQAEARKNVDAGWRVRAGEKGHACFVQQLNDLELLLKEFLAGFEVVGTEFGFDLFREFLPGLVLPVGRNILGAGVFAEVGNVNEVAAAFPDERRTLPGLVFREKRAESSGTCRVVGSEEAGLALVALKEFVLERRAAFKNPDLMLEAAHAGLRNFARAH